MSASTLDGFWLRMASMFGHPWVSQYGAAPDGVAGDTWAAVLAGLTPHQIAAGLRAVSLVPSDWPPTAPRFRSLCLGIPTLPQVRIELRAGNPEPSPFARLLWDYLDAYHYRRADMDKADRMLREAYELASAYVMDGGALPQPTAQITAAEAEAVKVAAPEVARRYMDEIGLTLKVAGDVLTEGEAERQQGAFQEGLAELERQSEPDFRRRAAGDV